MKNKITLLASLISLSFMNNAFSQNEEAKDNLGHSLLYCKNYMMKTANNSELLAVQFDHDSSNYYLKMSSPLLESNPESSFQFRAKDENKNQCGTPVHVHDLFSIVFKDMNDNNKYLTYQKKSPFNAYYNGREFFPGFYIQKGQEKGYNLVNEIDKSKLFCFSPDSICTSVSESNVQNSSFTSFVFIALEKEEGECDQNTGLCKIIQKADQELVNFDQTVIQPVAKELDKAFVKLDKEITQPAAKQADKKLVELDEGFTQPIVKEVDKAFVKFDEEVTQPVAKFFKKLF